MRLHIPTGLTAVLASFNQVMTALTCLDPDHEALISASFRSRLEPAQRQLIELSERQMKIKLAWSQALGQRNDHLATLRRLVRDSWLMLRRRDQREGQEHQLTLLYQVPALAPPHASPAIWLQHARNLLQGEAHALELGFAPMAFPSAAELAQCLDLAERAQVEFVELTLRLKDAEVALRKQQRLAVHLLRCLAARLRESQFDQDTAKTRVLLRCFGYRFKSTPSDDAEARAELAQAEQHPLVQAPSPAVEEGGITLLEPETATQGSGFVLKPKHWFETWRSFARTPLLQRRKDLASAL